MRSNVAITPDRLTTTWSTVILGIGIAIVLALGMVLAVGLVRGPRLAEPGATVSTTAGYPGHYGLAGPSRVPPNAASWMGYPAHFGLAGPSSVRTGGARIAIGPGYPPHYGLAGRSQLEGSR